MVFIIFCIYYILMKKLYVLLFKFYIKLFGFLVKYLLKGISFYLGFEMCEIFIFVFFF